MSATELKLTAAALLAGLTGTVFWSDLRYRIISNRQVLWIALLSVALTGGAALTPLPLLLAGLAGTLIFAHGFMAGGDIKLALAFLPGIYVHWWPECFLVVAVTGGCLALAYGLPGLLGNRRTMVRYPGLPYGIPIATAGFIGVLLTAITRTPG